MWPFVYSCEFLWPETSRPVVVGQMRSHGSTAGGGTLIRRGFMTERAVNTDECFRDGRPGVPRVYGCTERKHAIAVITVGANTAFWTALHNALSIYDHKSACPSICSFLFTALFEITRATQRWNDMQCLHAYLKPPYKRNFAQ